MPEIRIFTRIKGELINRIQSANIRVARRNIRYFYGGKGDSLVVVHGGGGGVSAWIKNLEFLSEHYTVYAPDLPGFGNSQSIDDRFSVPEYVRFLDDFVNTLGLDKFHLVGHSVGGGIAVTYALEYPQKIKRLVLVSSLFLGSEIALWARYLSSPAVFRYLGEAGLGVFKTISWLAGHICHSCKITPPFTRVQMAIGKSIMSFRGQTNVLFDRLKELVMPVLLVWGARDSIVPVKHAYAAADVIPDSRVQVIDGCGHHVHNQKSEEFLYSLVRFLGRDIGS